MLLSCFGLVVDIDLDHHVWSSIVHDSKLFSFIFTQASRVLWRFFSVLECGMSTRKHNPNLALQAAWLNIQLSSGGFLDVLLVGSQPLLHGASGTAVLVNNLRTATSVARIDELVSVGDKSAKEALTARP